MENILHISDLHISTNTRHGLHFENSTAIANATAKDAIKTMAASGKKIDSIIFSGDIAFSGKADEYEKALSYFINPLLEQLELTHRDIYICPGNHDSDRSAVDRFEKSYRESSELQDKNQLAKDIMSGSQTWKRVKAYNDFRSLIDKEKNNVAQSNQLFSTYKITERFHLLCLSSSWLAQDDNDKGQLFISEPQIKEAIRSTPTNSQRLMIIHHPTGWLDQEDNKQISTQIEKKIDALLFGHMHEFDQSIESKFSEEITLRLQAGTLDPGEENPGYSIVCLQNRGNIKYGKIIYRKYCKESKEYTQWNERGKNGEFDFSTDGHITFDSEKFSTLSGKILDRADKELLINTGLSDSKKKTVRDLFISPNLGRPDCIEMFSSVKKIKTFEELLNFKGVAIISGGVKKGKSFALQYIYAKKLEKQAARNFSQIAFHLDCKVEKLHSKSRIIQKLCETYIDPDLGTSFEKKIKQSISDGCATILIDNFCEATAAERSSIIDFIEENPLCNYTISISTAEEMSVIGEFSDRERLTVGATSIGILKRTNIREIISKWAPSMSFDTEDRIFSDVMQVVKNSQLPHNHFIYSMLLAIYENKRELKGILNEADVIENFIEILLKKHFVSTSPNQPQYKELLHFLGFLCHEIILKGCYSFERNNLLGMALDFNKYTMFSYPAESYIEPLISSGILTNTPPHQFTQVCFLDYGIAYYMQHSKDLLSHVFAEKNYLRHDKAIEYFASKNPSSVDALKFIKEKTDIAIQTARDIIIADHKIDISTLDLNKIDNISFLDIASTSEQFEEKIKEVKSDRAKHDELMDKISPLEPKEKSAQRPKPFAGPGSSDCIINLRENLSLYSRIFRSTELIMDPAETLSFFEDIVIGHIYLTKAIISRLDEDLIIPLIMPKIDSEFLAEGVTQEERDEFISTFKTFISVIKGVIPNHVQGLMSENLSSRKPRLHNIIERAIKDNDNDVILSLLIFLLLDIERGDTIKNINALININTKFSKTATFFKIIQMLTNKHDLPEEVRTYLSKSALQLVSSNKEGLGQRIQMFQKRIEAEFG